MVQNMTVLPVSGFSGSRDRMNATMSSQRLLSVRILSKEPSRNFDESPNQYLNMKPGKFCDSTFQVLLAIEGKSTSVGLKVDAGKKGLRLAGVSSSWLRGHLGST